MDDLFRYAPDVLDRFPTIAGGVIAARHLGDAADPGALFEAYMAEQAAVLDRIGDTLLSEVPSLAAWRRVFSAFGVAPTKYRNAAESLLRRLTKKGDIPSIAPLVDIGNLVSIRYGLPVAVFDLSGFDAPLTVSFADGSEQFADLGSSESIHPEPGEVVFLDGAGEVHARRWCWRQSGRSAAGPATTDVLITIEGHHDGADLDVTAAVSDLTDLLAVQFPEAGVESARAV